jgi:hypothetical protein
MHILPYLLHFHIRCHCMSLLIRLRNLAWMKTIEQNNDYKHQCRVKHVQKHLVA